MAGFFWLLIVVSLAISVLIAIKGYGWLQKRAASAEKKVSKLAGSARSTLDSELDDWVQAAGFYWPVLRPMPLFWIAVLFAVGMIVLDIAFGLSRGGYAFGVTTVVYILLFVGADLALPVVAVRSDRGKGNWYEVGTPDRSITSSLLISLFTFMSIVVVIGSTSETATLSNANVQATTNSYREINRQIQNKTAIRDSLVETRIAKGGMSREALEIRARETAEAAEREANRKRCGSKCEALKKEAQEWESQAANARKEEELNQELASLTAQLKEAADNRTEGDTLAKFNSDFLGIPEEYTQNWGLTFLGFFFAIGNTVLWLMVGDEAGRARAREYARRAAIADEELNTRGKPPRYTVASEATLALPSPEAKTGDTIIVNVKAEDMRRRFSNDADLLEADALFGTLLEANEGGMVTTSDLYRLYQIDKLRNDPSARYMTQPTMVSKLFIIAQHRDDIEVTSDGRIIGWTARQASAQAAE